MRFLRLFCLALSVCLTTAGALVLAVGPPASPIALTTLGAVYTQPFDTLASTGTSNVVPPGWTFDESNANANGLYAAGTGSSNAGDTYSFGATGSGERALGGLRSGSLVPVLGAAFINNTGQPIRTLTITYTGEQWRLGTAGRAEPDRLDFQVGASATSLTSTGYTDVDSLDFVAPITTGTVGALNGNLAANRSTLSATVAGIDIPDGATFWIRWTDFDASGADDGLAVDDFSLTAETGPLSTNPTATGSADPPSNVAGGTTLLTAQVTGGTNPASTGITVRANLSSIGGSTTQSFFDDGTHGDATAGDGTFSFTATVGAVAAGAKTFAVTVRDAQGRAASTSIPFVVELPTTTAIHDIQGAGNVSPFAGSMVMTRGIVTGVKFNGFFIQTPPAEIDADVNTSEGVFVFTNSTPPPGAVIGNLVKVIGNVSEFKSTTSDPDGLSATEVTNPTVAIVSTGNTLPVAITLSTADLFAAATPFQLEKYEGMRVHVDSVQTTSPTGGSVNETDARSTTTGLFFGVLPGTPRPFREPGIQTPLPVPAEAPAGAHPPIFDGNYERIGVDTFSVFQDPATAAVFPPPAGSTLEVTTGVTVNNVTGPLDYSFRSYVVDAEDWDRPTVSSGTPNMTVRAVRERGAGEFTVASMNTERFFDTVDDPQSDAVLTEAALQGRLQKISLVVRDVLQMPDIIGVEEMENLANLQRVANRVNDDAALDGLHPGYQAFLVEGNDVGGIDSGLLVRADRVDLAPGHFTVTQYGGDTTFVEPGGPTALLNDRLPLVLDAKVLNPPFEPYPVTVIVNHLRSLSGVDGTDGLRIRTKRRLQAEYLAQLIRSFQDQGKHVVSVGDYNAFDVNDGYVDVVGIAKATPAPADQVTQNTTLTAAQMPNPPLTDLLDLAPATERYSFLFDGNAQELDHILATGDLAANALEYGRVNADFPESLRGDFSRPERVSDHDPIVAYFNTPDIDTVPPTLNLPPDITIEGNTTGGATVTYTATAHDGVDGDLEPVCSPPSGAVFALGTTDVNCLATDAHGNFTTGTFHVTVVDTTAPTIDAIGASPSTIWPPNKRMVPVTITVNAADIVSATTSRIVSIAGDDGAGSGDAQIAGALTALVRADRTGLGNGRTYTFTVETKDAAGNTVTSSVAVFVPHDLGK